MEIDSNENRENSTAITTIPQDVVAEPILEGSVDKTKSSRHSRWTRHETFVLIEGKKVAEERGRKGRRSNSGFGFDPLEPKWDAVSSYCKQHGVNRGPVQCRKRWSNLVGDFRKIQTWEESFVKEEGESFWMMRNDLKKERKLPGFFDKEVYDVLDGKAFSASAYQLPMVTVSAGSKDEGEEMVVMEEDEGEEEEENVEGETIFDSGRQAAAAEEALFFESEEPVKETSPDKERDTIHSPVPISEKYYQPFYQVYANQGLAKGNQPGLCFSPGSISKEGCKRRRISTDVCTDINLEDRLINVLEKNANILNSQLEAHNTNLQLDRDQQKDQNESLIDALKKVTEALTRIADKLTKDN